MGLAKTFFEEITFQLNIIKTEKKKIFDIIMLAKYKMEKQSLLKNEIKLKKLVTPVSVDLI